MVATTPPIARGGDRSPELGGMEPVRQTLVTSDGVRLAANWYPGREAPVKSLLAIVYYLYPAVARAFGYLPGRRLGLGTSIPGDVFLQWCRWGREGVYTDESGASLEHLYASVTQPILCFSFEDDRRYAPRPAVMHLHRQVTNATVEYRHGRPP